MAAPSSTPLGSKKRLAVIGFDGFIDDIATVVASRENEVSFTPMHEMAEMGQMILNAANHSCNIEIIAKERKIGGNAPIMAEALLNLGHSVSLIGAIGKAHVIEPLFQPLAKRCEKAVALCPSGHTDALEFNDGKILLGRHETILGINYELLLKSISKPLLTQLLDRCDLFASVNWTMLPGMNDIWEGLQREILPSLSKRQAGNERILFIDLADPTKRPSKDLLKALELLPLFGLSHRVILGLNVKEIACVAKACGLTPPPPDEGALLSCADLIRNHFKLHMVLVHSKDSAMVAAPSELHAMKCPPCEKPKLSTGAGDNFNAGFCAAILNKMTVIECLGHAIATAGYYIRNGQSPDQDQVGMFMKENK